MALEKFIVEALGVNPPGICHAAPILRMMLICVNFSRSIRMGVHCKKQTLGAKTEVRIVKGNHSRKVVGAKEAKKLLTGALKKPKELAQEGLAQRDPTSKVIMRVTLPFNRLVIKRIDIAHEVGVVVPMLGTEVILPC